MNRGIRFIELFAGIGGFRYGLERAGEETLQQADRCRGAESGTTPVSTNEEQSGEYHREPTEGEKRTNTFTCVWANEWDKYAAQIYRRRFGARDRIHNTRKRETERELSTARASVETKDGEGGIGCEKPTPVVSNGHEPSKLYEGDIRAVDPAAIPDHDLLVAGFPCQSFSIAGKRGGFEDTRGTLFFEICRVLRAKRPRMVLLENVKGLLSHDQGDTFQAIIESLDELGYDCEWEVLNSKNYGVPQNRERVFIIGHLRGTPRPQVFPLGEGSGENDKTRALAVAILATDWRGGNRNSKQNLVAMTAYTKGNRTDSRVQETDTYPCLDGSQAYAAGEPKARLVHNSFPDKERVYEDYSPTISTPSGGGHLPFVEQPIAPTIRAEHHNTADVHYIIHNMQPRIRRLTPRECERLQGFPDDWTRWGTKEGQVVEMSDTQRYKMCGNAVTTNVITAIGERILAGWWR